METVSPVIVEDIELYVSADGKESGMSISALARFIGKTEASLRTRILSNIDKSDEDRAKPLPKTLEPFAGKAFSTVLAGVNGAKIVPAKTCEALIFYYAFEKQDSQALFAYRKFAQKGLHQWIKEATNSIEDKNDSRLLATVQEILSEVRGLKEVSKRYTAIREKTSTYMTGTDDLLNLLEDNSGMLPSANDGLFPDGKMSLEAWLYYKKDGLTLPRPLFRRLASIVAETYRSLVKDDPEKRHCIVAGKKKYNVSVYSEIHFPILQVALNKVMA